MCLIPSEARFPMRRLAPFVKFTEKEQGTTGEHRQLRFINVEQIASALFVEQTGQLKLILVDKSTFTIDGEEAQAALKILQTI